MRVSPRGAALLQGSDSKIANIMYQDQMATLIKIKSIQRQRIIALQSGVYSKLVVPVDI